MKDIIEAAKAVSTDGLANEYKEASAGAGKAIGEAVLITAKTVRALVSPLRGIIWSVEQVEKYFVPQVEEKLKNVPPEKRIEPDLAVLGPAVEALKFRGNSEQLRDLFANLIATAIDADTAKTAHPSFVEIIKQLSPDEAKILKYLSKNLYKGEPIIDLRLRSDRAKTGYILYAENVSELSDKAECLHPELVAPGIVNLCRLGLCDIPAGVSLSNKDEYKPIEDDPNLKLFMTDMEQKTQGKIIVFRKILAVTPFGRQFCEACIVSKN